MSRVIELSRSRFWPRAAALTLSTILTLLTIGVASCSDESTRFSDSSYRGNREATGSIPQGQPAPVGRVDSRPLPPPTAQGPVPPASIEVTGSVAPAQRPAPAQTGH